MKRIFTLLLLVFCVLISKSQNQQIKIVSYTVKNKLTAVIDSWNSIPGALILVAQKPPTIRIDGVRLMIQIKQNGAVICGNNPGNGLPVDDFTTRSFSSNELTGALSGCHDLKDGSYMLCAQFFNGERKPVSEESCKPFMVETPKQTDYSPPTLITPENGKGFTEAELQRPVMFRWTPLVPKPQEPVTYRLKVWQLMQGQSGTQAMRSNQPIVTKDVDNITQTVVNGVITGPCRPPYLCDFIWAVQAVDRDGKPLGRNEGNSEPFTFSVKESVIQPDIKNVFPEDKKQFKSDEIKKSVTFRWTPVVPKPQGTVTYRLKVWQLMQGQNGAQAMRSNQPIVTKDVDNITQVEVSGIYTGPCKPPYLCDYIWVVEARIKNAAGVSEPIATSNPYTINVGVESTDDTSIIEGRLTLTNSFPENNKEFNPGEIKKSVTFRWTPVVPKPQGAVTYRLKVWQLMQGQNGTQAMRSNQPIVTKDVDNITQVEVSGIYTGPCRPPYLCDFIWMVEATTGNTPGTPPHVIASSEPTIFAVKENETKVTLKNVFPEDNKSLSFELFFDGYEEKGTVKKPLTYKWTPVTPKPQEPVTYRLKVWQLMQGQSGSQAMRTNQPIVTKDVDNLTEIPISSEYNGPCKPPYLCDFIWMVEASTRTAAGTAPHVIASSEPTVFKVNTTGEIKPPVNVYPGDKTTIGLNDAMNAIRFKWKPVEPNQPGITYKLKVWQLMQGQNSAMAIKTNQPVAKLDVDGNGTTDALTDGLLMRLLTGPCRPPYLCDFVWTVQAVNKEGKLVGSNEGTSAPTMFAVSQYIIQLDSIKVSCTAKPGVYAFSFTLTNPNPGTAKLTNFVATSSTPAGATITSFTPPLNTTIAPGNQLTITGTITGSPNLSNICIGAEITDNVNSFWKASKDTCIDVVPCKCNACDSVKINIVQKDISFNANGQIVLNTNISISPKKVKSMKAELVYYEYKPENDDCMICNKDSKTYGNFDNGTIGNTSGTGNGTHELAWNYMPPASFNGGLPASMVITVPPTVSCCNANIKWCIRYVVTFEDCTVCNKLVCYEKKKEGCAKGNPNPNDQK